jgi:23S rRNA pseudouridine1911/1915/1917 synthase
MSIIYKKFSGSSFEVCYEVHSPQDGMRLDQFLLLYFPSFSRQQVKEKIKNKEVIIQERIGVHKPNTKVYDKERIIAFVYKSSHEDEWWNGEKIELQETPDIVFEDDNLFIISKPPYMSTHPTGKHLFNCATVYLESLTKKTAHSVHRLDRETSGVLILAKNPKAANQYTVHFEKNNVSKCYFFIGVANDDYEDKMEFSANERLDTGGEGLLRVLIGHYPHDSQAGKVAQTHFKILYQHGPYLLGLAFPVTGRQHQIRVHALAHGFPLLGDKIYYGSYKMFQSFKDRYATEEDYAFMQLPRHALHATAINLPFGESNERRTFHSSLPHDLIDWIKSNFPQSIEDIQRNVLSEIDSYFNKLNK